MALAARNSGAADGDLRLTIHLAKSKFRAGEAIPLEWTLENLSPQPVNVIAFHQAGGGPQFQELSLHLSSGGGAPRPIPTAFLSGAIRPVWRPIAPGAQLKQEMDLARSLAMMVPRVRPGSYRLTAEYAMRGMPSPEGQPSWSGRTAAASANFEIVP
jgi:hypothetical protein